MGQEASSLERRASFKWGSFKETLKRVDSNETLTETPVSSPMGQALPSSKGMKASSFQHRRRQHFADDNDPLLSEDEEFQLLAKAAEAWEKNDFDAIADLESEIKIKLLDPKKEKDRINLEKEVLQLRKQLEQSQKQIKDLKVASATSPPPRDVVFSPSGMLSELSTEMTPKSLQKREETQTASPMA